MFGGQYFPPYCHLRKHTLIVHDNLSKVDVAAQATPPQDADILKKNTIVTASASEVLVKTKEQGKAKSGEDDRIACAAWVPKTFLRYVRCIPSSSGKRGGRLSNPSCSRLRKILDWAPVDSTESWYTLTTLPVSPLSWVRRSATQSVLYVFDMPARLFVAAPVGSLYFYSSLTDNMARSRITLKLGRAADRAGLARLQDKGRSTLDELLLPPSSPMERFTAIALHNRAEVSTYTFWHRYYGLTDSPRDRSSATSTTLRRDLRIRR